MSENIGISLVILLAILMGIFPLGVLLICFVTGYLMYGIIIMVALYYTLFMVNLGITLGLRNKLGQINLTYMIMGLPTCIISLFTVPQRRNDAKNS